jgi:Lrp/AsnC family leucine-responsive transcriptional regulator
MSTVIQLLDGYDDRILQALQADARITLAELGRRVHLSQPAVTERVRKLEFNGVIKGYTAQLDYAALGYNIRAIVQVGRCDYARIVTLIEQTPEVINAFNVTGEVSWVLEIVVRDVAHLDAVVNRFCLLAETSTNIVLKAPREGTPVSPVMPLTLSVAAAK